MSAPPSRLLDPLDGWPRVDPRVDYIGVAIRDLGARADRWDQAGELVRQAVEALAEGRGAACEVARLRAAELALAITGFAGPLRDVASVLDAYLLAYERYQEELRVAEAVARDSIREVMDLRREGRSADPSVPWTPLRQRAWDLANAALETFIDAGQQAAALVEAATAMITGGWVDTENSCRSASLLEVLIGGGETESAIRGVRGAIGLGLQLLVLQRRGLLTPEDLQRVRKKLTVGGTTLTSEDGRLRALAGAVAMRAGVGQGAFAILGVASGLAQLSVLAVGDAATVIDGGGASGVHAVVNRTAAAANGVAGTQLAIEVFEKAGLRAVSSIAVPVFIATSAYELGDLVYTHRARIVATFEGFAGHRAAEKLP